jgi:allantoinase
LESKSKATWELIRLHNYDLVIKNGYIVTENAIYRADLGISNGKIAEISASVSAGKSVGVTVDAAGMYILPGLIDAHVHLNEPGRVEWEGFRSGSRSLAAGGVTTFFDMPLNSHPPTTTCDAFELKQQLAMQKSAVHFKLWGGLVPGNLEHLKTLHDKGVIGFKAFMSNSSTDDFKASDDATLFAGMQKIAELGSILAVHAESEVITRHLTKAMLEKGILTARAYAGSRPVESEIEAVQKVLAYAKVTGCKIHIVHVSSRKVIQIIQNAKREQVDVTVETCPHYLALTVDDLENIGPIAKCAPPLRDPEEVELMWEAFKNGEIDTIGSDHSPAPPDMKTGNIFEAWGGISGAQSTLNVLLEEGYFKRNVPLETIVRLTSANPAKRFNLYPGKGSLTVGSDADFTVVDLNQSFYLQRESLLYRHPYSPYTGKKFRGRVISTFLGGRCVYQYNGQEVPAVENNAADHQ